MIIANPIYDTIFKHLMEDVSIAKGFLSRVLRKEIYDLTFLPQERSDLIPENSGRDRIKIFHLDFIAEIEMAEGRKKVLIELQKSSAYAYPHRFRAYIGKLYNKDKHDYDNLVAEEKKRVEKTGDKFKRVPEPEVLPVIPIFIFGFELEPSDPSKKMMIIEYKRKAYNPNEQINENGIARDKELNVTYKLAECLSHDLIMIQIPFIPEEPKTDLEKILSIFEQRFLQKDHWFKEYNHHFKDPLLLLILKKLEIIAKDEEIVETLQKEHEGELMFLNIMAMQRENAILLKKQKKELESKDKELESKDKELESNKKELESNKKELESKDKELESNKKELEDKDKMIADLLKQLKK